MIGDSLKEWEIIRDISLLGQYKELSFTDLSRLLHISNTHSIFIKVLSYLIDEGAIVLSKKIGPTNLYLLNYKRIDSIFRDTKIFQLNGEWIEKKVLGYRY